MTQEISSLMDGEAAAQEAEGAIRLCGTSEEHKETWYLYHAIGDAMRGQAPRVLSLPAEVIEALKAQLLARQPVSCDTPSWLLFGVSLAGWNLVASVLLAIACAAALLRRERR